MRIPAEGSHGVCIRSPEICDRAHTPHAAQCRHMADTPGPPWAGRGQTGAQHFAGNLQVEIRLAAAKDRMVPKRTMLHEPGEDLGGLGAA